MHVHHIGEGKEIHHHQGEQHLQPGHQEEHHNVLYSELKELLVAISSSTNATHHTQSEQLLEEHKVRGHKERYNRTVIHNQYENLVLREVTRRTTQIGMYHFDVDYAIPDVQYLREYRKELQIPSRWSTYKTYQYIY